VFALIRTLEITSAVLGDAIAIGRGDRFYASDMIRMSFFSCELPAFLSCSAAINLTTWCSTTASAT
jgi:hypothetical protein